MKVEYIHVVAICDALVGAEIGLVYTFPTCRDQI